MEQEKLSGILQAHKKWLDSNREEGARANLRGADLRDTDLRGADLTGADLHYADMDYAVLPLWCGGLHMHVDDRIGIQLLYHAVANILFSKNTSVWLKKAVSLKTILRVVNKFHRVDECGKVEPYCEVKPNEKP